MIYGNVSIARAAADVLLRAEHPLTLDELERGVAALLGRDVLRHSLRAAIYYHLGGEEAWFERLSRGRYALTQQGRIIGHAA